MKDLLIFFPLTIIYLAIKSTLLPEIPLPDITLLVIFYVAFTRATVEGAVLGFVLGYIEDIFTGGVIGSTSFALVACFLAVHVASRRMHFTTAAVKAATAASLSVLKGILVYVILDFTSAGLGTVADIVLQALLTGVFAPAVLASLAWVTSVVRPRTFDT